jgi:hypothetical protein
MIEQQSLEKADEVGCCGRGVHHTEYAHELLCRRLREGGGRHAFAELFVALNLQCEGVPGDEVVTVLRQHAIQEARYAVGDVDEIE